MKGESGSLMKRGGCWMHDAQRREETLTTFLSEGESLDGLSAK